MKIDGRDIGKDHPPYIIAEMSANHNRDINRAFKIIDEAKKAGANAVKLQSYCADTITLNSNAPDFQIPGGLWAGKNLYQLYQDSEMPWEWHKPLFEYAHEIGITIFSSPFDETAVDLLEELNAPAYKIASFEAIDLPLIKYVASTGKPMIISTGMADDHEIAEAISMARAGGCNELAILHCISGYPAPAEDYNLNVIPDMIKRFGIITGLSDHTIDNTTAICSIALGASIIEKHVTLDRQAGGTDDSFSLEPEELKELCDRSSIAWSALGQIDYGRKSSEKDNVKFRRSLYFVKALRKGDIINREDIRSVRPGLGLPPKSIEEIIGKKVTRDIDFATAVTRDSFE